MEYLIPESEWTIVIQYTYQHTDDDKARTETFTNAMKTYEAIGSAVKVCEKVEEEEHPPEAGGGGEEEEW